MNKDPEEIIKSRYKSGIFYGTGGCFVIATGVSVYNVMLCNAPGATSRLISAERELDAAKDALEKTNPNETVLYWSGSRFEKTTYQSFLEEKESNVEYLSQMPPAPTAYVTSAMGGVTGAFYAYAFYISVMHLVDAKTKFINNWADALYNKFHKPKSAPAPQ